MEFLKRVGLLLVLMMAFACTQKETIIKYHDRTLVIVSDNNEATDLIMAIQGAVRANYPDVEIHYFQTKPFNIKEASYLLNEAIGEYPVGTCFVGLVEPGTGGERIVFETGEKRVLCPDNGISSWTIENNPADSYYFVEDSKITTKSSELPFQDFYVNAILSLLSEKPLNEFGEICPSPVFYDIQSPVLENDTTKGEVIFVDNFGNCITNIATVHLANPEIGVQYDILADTTEFQMIFGTHYGSVPVGENVCFINASGRLEMAINYGDLSAKYNIQAGTKVFLSKVR